LSIADTLRDAPQDVVDLSLKLRSSMVEVDQLAAEVRAEREKVQNMRRHPKLRSLVLMRLQVQRVKSIAGKLLKVSKSPVLSRDIVFECVCVCVCVLRPATQCSHAAYRRSLTRRFPGT
jgi:hypothetical protein